MWIAGFTLFLLGIILVIVAPINKRKNSRCSAQAEGKLINTWEREDSEGPTGTTYLYSYNVDGKEYQTKSTICSKEVKEVGDACTIWYNPKRPKDAQPFHYESAKVYRIIIVIGIALILVGFILFVCSVAQSS